MAGETGFEPATGGFGDRCSTVEPLPYAGAGDGTRTHTPRGQQILSLPRLPIPTHRRATR